MTVLRSYWRWLGRWLRLSNAGRVLFNAALLLGGGAMVVARLRGDSEGGAPLVVLTLLLAGVVSLDAICRRVVTLVRRLTGGGLG